MIQTNLPLHTMIVRLQHFDLKDFSTKKKQFLVGGQRSDGFGVCLWLWWSLVEVDGVIETYWLDKASCCLRV